MLVLVIGILGFIAFVGISYFVFIQPALQVMAERRGLPPADGTTLEILLDHNRRTETVSVGQLDSSFKTRMMGIKDDHLLIRIRKEPDLEEYEITIHPGGPLFYRPPHGAKMEQIKGPENFESSELIGHPAQFRLAAFMQHNRLLQYVEFEFSCSFTTNRSGEEKMKFHLKMNRIFPGVDKKRPPKKGVYFFSRLRSDEETEESDS